MSTIREVMRQEVAEGGSALITGYFEDETGASVPLSAFSTVQLWLYNNADGAAINSKTATDIKNANNGTVAPVVETVNGVATTRTKFTLQLLAADNPMVDSTRRTETHIATIKGTYNSGTGVVEKELVITVRNLLKP